MMQVIENNSIIIETLKKRSDFLRIASLRKKWISPTVIIQTSPTPREIITKNPIIRVGYTASKKVGNAVKRNKAKRRLREAVRQVMSSLGHKNHDYVFIARTDTVNLSYQELIRDMKWSLKRLHKKNDENSSL